MRTAAVSLAVYTLLAFGLAGYGFSIDRFAGLIGFLPGFLGMLGVMYWATTDAGLYASMAHDHAEQKARCARIYAQSLRYTQQRAGR